MAIFTAIPEKTQTAAAMKRVLNYVMQDKKTVIDGIKLVRGQHCVPESAYQEFMATKHQYGKAKGVFFKQYDESASHKEVMTFSLIGNDNTSVGASTLRYSLLTWWISSLSVRTTFTSAS